MALRTLVMAYTDMEDELLPTVLERIDAWGHERAERMRREHRRRREAVERTLAAIDACTENSAEAKRWLCALCEELSRDLAMEEQQILREDLLSDDLSVTDVITG